MCGGLFLGFVVSLAVASTQGDLLKWGIFTDGKNVTLPDGDLTLTEGALNVPVGLTTLGSLKLVEGTVSVTSPTVTIDVTGLGLATINSDANQTGHRLIGGVEGQIVILRTGSGSNTLRFDDATSMSAGGNITMTEGQDDISAWRCKNSSGVDWECIFAHDN